MSSVSATGSISSTGGGTPPPVSTNHLTDLFHTTIKWMNWIKSDTVCISKACKLVGYSAAYVASCNGGLCAFGQIADFWKNADEVFDASFMLDDSAYLAKTLAGAQREPSRVHTYGRLALLAADVGGWALMGAKFGFYALTPAATAAFGAMAGTAVAVAFAFFGYEGYRALSSPRHTQDSKNQCYIGIAHSIGEVASHALMVVNVNDTLKLATGVFAAATAIAHHIHGKTMKEVKVA